MSVGDRDVYGLVVRFDLLDGHEGAFDALTEECWQTWADRSQAP